MKGGLEKAELWFTLSVTTTLFWAIRQADGGDVAKNGSAFFINTGERLFGCHRRSYHYRVATGSN
jgi:hypothetical protein